jgi:hypothetical protein
MLCVHFLLLLAVGPVDTTAGSSRRDTASAEVARVGSVLVAMPVPAGLELRVAHSIPARDTSVSIEYSEWYGRRLTIHRWASYSTLPLFAFQFLAGRELYEKSSDAPAWARKGHGVAATGVAALFVVNTVTGVWNLWDARKDPEDRTRRTAHGLLMLAADAGFTATGMLAESAERSPEDRRLHRRVALTSMGVATVSYLIMLIPQQE